MKDVLAGIGMMVLICLLILCAYLGANRQMDGLYGDDGCYTSYSRWGVEIVCKK